MKKNYFILLFILLCNINIGLSQFAIVEFRVYDQQTNKPLEETTIQCSSKSKISFTDKNGISKISVSFDTLHYFVSFEKYISQTLHFSTERDTTVNVYLILKQKSVLIEEVTVIANAIHSNRIEISIASKNIQFLPSIGGTPDIGKMLVKLGGVHELNEGAGDILVRGGLPKHVSYIVSNRVKTTTSAALGLVSPFNANLFSETVLNKSYVSPKFSDYLSGVVYMKPQMPDNKSIRFKLNANPFLSGVYFSMPLLKEKSGIAFSVRHSIFPYISKILGDIIENSNFENVHYTDFNMLSSIALNANWSINAAFDFMNDNVSEVFKSEIVNFYKENTNLHMDIDAELNLQYKSENKEIEIFTVYTNRQNNYIYKEISDSQIQNEKTGYTTQDLNAGISVSQKIKNHSINYGFKLSYLNISPYLQKYNNNITNFERSINAGVEMFNLQPYAEINSTTKSKFTYRSGFTMQGIIIGTKLKLLPEPRILMRYAFFEKLALETAYMRSHRLLQYVSNTTVGFPRQVPIVPGNYVPATTDQISFTAETNIGKGDKLIEFTGSFFYKNTGNALWFKPNYTIEHILYKVAADKPENALQNYSIESLGFEFLAHKSKGNFMYSISYTLSKSLLVSNEKKEISPFDIPHQFNIEMRKNFGKRISMGINWTYHTGLPIKIPTYEYELPYLYFGVGNDKLQEGHSRYLGIYTHFDTKTYRVKAYHRLDVSFEYKLKAIKSNRHAIRLDIINIYNRLNPYYLNFEYKGYQGAPENFVMYREIKGGHLYPILPTISYVLEF